LSKGLTTLQTADETPLDPIGWNGLISLERDSFIFSPNGRVRAAQVEIHSDHVIHDISPDRTSPTKPELIVDPHIFEDLNEELETKIQKINK